MKITPMKIPEILLIKPEVFGDRRGFFLESWQRRKFSEFGFEFDFVQDNHSRSSKNVLRGLHYQLKHPQGKLVRVVAGAVFDVAVDIRIGSPTFGQWCGIELSEHNHLQLFIPPGFAHGFCVLSEKADFLYKCTDYYAPEYELGIRWDDPQIGVSWPGGDYIISDKDNNCGYLNEMIDLLPIYRASK